MVAAAMWPPTLTSLLVASALADANPAIPDTTGRVPYLRPPAEVEFAAPRSRFPPSPSPWRDAGSWNDAFAVRPEALLRPPEPAGRDSLLRALLLARCGRQSEPGAAWRPDPSLGFRLRLLRLEASWLPAAVRRLLLGQARAAEFRRLKAREAEFYDEFLGTEIPVTGD